MPETDNTQSLGDSTHRWKFVGALTGNADTATAVKDYNNNTLTKFGYSTSGMTSTSWVGSWDASTSGEYRLRAISPQKLRNSMGLGDTTGALPVANGGTGNTSYTANRLIYSESTSKLSASGHYASSTGIAVNSTSNPSYNFYVNGTSYHNGLDTHAGNIVPEATRSRYLGTSSLYWNGAYINGNGAIQWNNLGNPNINGTTPIITTDSYRGMGRIIGGRGDVYRPANAFFGVKQSSITFEYTTNGGSTWTTKDISVINLFNEQTMSATVGFNTAGTAFDTYDATSTSSTTGGGSGVTYAANYWTNKGIRITFDCWDEGRTGTIDFLLMRFGCAGSNNKAHYIIERQHYTDANAGNDTWTLIYESQSTAWGSNDRPDQIYPNPNFYLSGTSTAAKSSYPSYAQKIRITFIVDAWPTAYRYAPRIISIAGYGATGALSTANAGTGSEFARAMVIWNHPYIIENRNTGALGFDSDLLPRQRVTEGSAIVTTNIHNIGASNRKWANVYATTIHGALDGNADTATRANITTTTNALAYYTNTTGTFGDSAITITKTSKHIAGFINGGQKSGTTLGTGATAEGINTTASGDYSHAEGVLTIASKDYSHAEGINTTASGYDSHAEGEGTTASGESSHAKVDTQLRLDIVHMQKVGAQLRLDMVHMQKDREQLRLEIILMQKDS